MAIHSNCIHGDVTRLDCFISCKQLRIKNKQIHRLMFISNMLMFVFVFMFTSP